MKYSPIKRQTLYFKHALQLSFFIIALLHVSSAWVVCDLAKLRTCCNDGGGDGCPKVAACTFDDFAKIGKTLAQCTATPANAAAQPRIPPQGARVYHPRATGYYPDGSRLEGGYRDRRGVFLHTLQDFLHGDVGWVSVSMDDLNGLPYGAHIRILELERKYNRIIDFRVVDTGGDFYDRGFDRIDICTASEWDSLAPEINGPLTIVILNTPPGDRRP